MTLKDLLDRTEDETWVAVFLEGHNDPLEEIWVADYVGGDSSLMKRLDIWLGAECEAIRIEQRTSPENGEPVQMVCCDLLN